MAEKQSAERLSENGTALYRIPIDYSAYYAVLEAAGSHSRPPALLIAIHGYGQSCERFIRNFSALAERNFLVVAPQAINQFYWERGKVGFTWLTKFMREQTLSDTFDYFERVLRAVEQDFVFDPKRVFLMGFSNGAAMAFRLGTSGLVKPAGIVACCGDLPADVAERLGDLERFPVLLAHGKEDTMVRLDKAHEAQAALRSSGFDTETLFFDGGHEMGAMEVDRILNWLQERASPP